MALREEITGKFCSQIMIIPNRAVSPTTENFCRKPGQLTVLERFFFKRRSDFWNISGGLCGERDSRCPREILSD